MPQRPPDALVKEIGVTNLVQAARQTKTRHYQAIGERGNDITPELWADVLRQLRPERVYLHDANIVVVLNSIAGKEQGLYICPPESSFMPSDGTDGFTFAALARHVSQFEG